LLANGDGILPQPIIFKPVKLDLLYAQLLAKTSKGLVIVPAKVVLLSRHQAVNIGIAAI